jgi:hypothetical protein
MTRALERRVQRVLDITNDLLAESKWTIWCYEVEHMPAMIDILVAKGTLCESDRPHCLHWTDIRGSGAALSARRAARARAIAVIKTAFGAATVASYLKLKHADWNSYCRHLSEWERQTTLDC